MYLESIIMYLQVEDAMKIKMCRQIRCIKKFAKVHHINNLDVAAEYWVRSGCAAIWAKQN